MPTRRLRVVVTGIPEMLRGLITDLLKDDGAIELLPRLDPPPAPGGRRRRQPLPDLVITDAGQATVDGPHVALLYRVPHLRVLGVARDGDAVRCLELQPVVRSLGQLSSAELLSVIKNPLH